MNLSQATNDQVPFEAVALAPLDHTALPPVAALELNGLTGGGLPVGPAGPGTVASNLSLDSNLSSISAHAAHNAQMGTGLPQGGMPGAQMQYQQQQPAPAPMMNGNAPAQGYGFQPQQQQLAPQQQFYATGGGELPAHVHQVREGLGL